MTPTQAVSSMLAALTGAVAASRLGIAGTIIGTAFMSLASTVGAAFYRHYITSSNKRLRAAASTFAPRASQTAVAAAVARHHAAQHGLDQTQVDQTHLDQTRVDQTQLDQTQLALPLHLNGDSTATRAEVAGPPGPGGHGGDWTWPWSRRRWLVVAGTALGVFVVAMAGVTVFEAAVGKPLDAVVWHQHNTGTTVGGLVGGSGGSGSHHPRPSTSPSHSASPSHSPSHSPSSSPSPTTSSPTPTPSGSPTPSSSTSPTAGASSPAPTKSAPAQTAAPGSSGSGG